MLAFVVEELGFPKFDILPPDATHVDNPPPIADYFIKLFDVWLDKYAARGVRIATLDAMIRGLVGKLSLSDTIGLGPSETVTLMPDGSLEPLDVLRITGDGATASKINVRSDAIKDVRNDPVWRQAFEASTHLCDTCMSCEYLDSCGGGHLAQRWSREHRYDNPSVYCESWKGIFSHIWERISPALSSRSRPPASVRPRNSGEAEAGRLQSRHERSIVTCHSRPGALSQESEHVLPNLRNRLSVGFDLPRS